jgi:hypothetical protein
MPLYIAKSEETWIPPYPATGYEAEAQLYPRQNERPLAERVHRGAAGGVWLGGRPSHSHSHPKQHNKGGNSVATTLKHGGGGGSKWFAVIGGKPGENIGGAVVSSWAAAERAISQVGRGGTNVILQSKHRAVMVLQ